MSDIRKLIHKIDNQFHTIGVMAFSLKDELKKRKKFNKKTAEAILTDIEDKALEAASLTNDVRQILKEWGKLE